MNKMTKLAAAIALASGAFAATPVMAESETSATVGFVSDYYFRGFQYGDAAAYASVDYANGGFYAGAWAIDYGNDGDDGADGAIEVDLYAGYAIEFENGLSLDLGVVQYEYTDSADDETEISLTAGFGAFSVNYTDGEDNNEGHDYDYEVYSISWSGEVFGVTYGHFENDEETDGAGDDYEHDWIEVTASGEVAGLDMTLAIGTTENVEVASEDDAGSDGYIILDISKSFDL
jgi:uncharacterized protein (TIGR02001 family)